MKNKPVFNRHTLIFGSIQLLSIGLLLVGINIYRISIIPIPILALSMIGGGGTFLFIIAVFIRFKLRSASQIFSVALLGACVSYFLILLLNTIPQPGTIRTDTFNIVERGSLPGRGNSGRKAYLVVDFHGRNKQLITGNQYAQKVKVEDYINLDYYTGLFGFSVIVNPPWKPLLTCSLFSLKL